MRILLTVSLLLLCMAVWAVEAGGSYELEANGVINSDTSFVYDIFERADIEIFIPKIFNQELKCQFVVNSPLKSFVSSDSLSVFIKKLYLRLNLKYAYITVGRQPVSWSFGSIFNPVDYTLGSFAMNEENDSRFTDAAELYLPINWNSGISGIVSVPTGLTGSMDGIHPKIGARLRFGVKGFDVTMNYVREADTESDVLPENPLTRFMPQKRIAGTVKGDILGWGVYSAVGCFFEAPDTAYYMGTLDGAYTNLLIGCDYSFYTDANTKMVFQAEYIGLNVGFLSSSVRSALLKMDSSDTWIDIISASLSWPIDDFNSLTVFTVINYEDLSFIVSPVYQTILPLNIDLQASMFVLGGDDGTLFAPSGAVPFGSAQIKIGYRF